MHGMKFKVRKQLRELRTGSGTRPLRKFQRARSIISKCFEHPNEWLCSVDEWIDCSLHRQPTIEVLVHRFDVNHTSNGIMRRSNDCEAADGLYTMSSVSVKALLATPGLTPSLSKRIEQADQDGSGGLSL